MKKFSIILAGLLAAAMAIGVTAAEPVTECYAPERAATIDGVVSAGEWDGATKLTLNISDTSEWSGSGAGIVGGTGYANHTDADFTTSLSFMFDKDYVYILMTRTDSTLQFTTDNYHTPYASDCGLMWFVDSDGIQYGLQLLASDKSGKPHIGYFLMDADQGSSEDLTEAGNAECVTKVDGNSYVMEAKVALSAMDDFAEIYKVGDLHVTWCAVNICEDGFDFDNGSQLWGENYQAQYLGVNSWSDAPILKFGEDTGAAAETPAEEAPAAEATAEIAPDYIDYTATDVAVSTGAFNTLDEAAASVELNPIKGYTFISGTESVGEKEPPAALWDDDVTTKFCVANTAQFPTISVAKLSAPATVSGIAFATANDNSKNPGRNPFEWAVFVSADGQNWTQLVYGDDTFLEDVDFTYYATKTQTVDNVQYVKFQSEGGLSGVFQMSEVVLLGETTAAPAEETKPETPADTVETPVETVETPVEEAPQTFDAVVIAAVTAVVSLAGYAVSKKR